MSAINVHSRTSWLQHALVRRVSRAVHRALAESTQRRGVVLKCEIAQPARVQRENGATRRGTKARLEPIDRHGVHCVHVQLEVIRTAVEREMKRESTGGARRRRRALNKGVGALWAEELSSDASGWRGAERAAEGELVAQLARGKAHNCAAASGTHGGAQQRGAILPRWHLDDAHDGACELRVGRQPVERDGYLVLADGERRHRRFDLICRFGDAGDRSGDATQPDEWLVPSLEEPEVMAAQQEERTAGGGSIRRREARYHGRVVPEEGHRRMELLTVEAQPHEHIAARLADGGRRHVDADGGGVS